jgi:hypothetical protein
VLARFVCFSELMVSIVYVEREFDRSKKQRGLYTSYIDSELRSRKDDLVVFVIHLALDRYIGPMESY